MYVYGQHPSRRGLVIGDILAFAALLFDVYDQVMQQFTGSYAIALRTPSIAGAGFCRTFLFTFSFGGEMLWYSHSRTTLKSFRRSGSKWLCGERRIC